MKRVKWTGSRDYKALESRVLAALRSDLTEREFNELALEVFRFQRRWNKPYARWCATLPEPRTWREIPAVPCAMFRHFRLAVFPDGRAAKTFRTSGTTGETRGEHQFLDTRLYDASIRAGWRRLKFPKFRAIILTPRPGDMPDSSLAHMMGVLARHEAVAANFGFTRHGKFAAVNQLCELATGDGRTPAGNGPGNRTATAPVAILGTALAFLNFFERLGNQRLRLPAGSFAVETGGYKGSGRDIPKAALYAKFREFLGLPADAVWNEYGMTELSSQAYTHGLGRSHKTPPWLRALVIDPETGGEVAVGETGVLRLFDLANLGSVLAIQTGDLAIRRRRGFELLGRDPGALPRGCSRVADETLRPGGTANPPEISRAERATRHQTTRQQPRSTRAQRPLQNTAARAAALAKAASAFPFLGKVTAHGLLALIAAELGHKAALDRPVRYGRHLARAVAPRNILHVISGNTPAAALQTMIRGLLLGSHNLCKLPSEGLPEAAKFRSLLPKSLAARIELSRSLPDAWLDRADAAVVFGRDETVAAFRNALPPGILFQAHGGKLSFALVFEDRKFASVRGAARDISVFDQQGCLSPHVVFVRENGSFTASAYARRLATAMDAFEKHSPRGPLTVSEANGIRTLRGETAFRAANGDRVELFASHGTAWTVIADSAPGFPASPLNRVVFVKPLPENPQAMLAPLRAHLGTCGIWPATPDNAAFAASLGVTRVCPLGRMQLPPLTWHHDGQPVLASLVRWVDFEPAS